MIGRPVPTQRAFVVAAVGLLPAGLAVLAPSVALACIVLDAALLIAIAVDFFRAWKVDDLHVARDVEPVLSSHRPTRVKLLIEQRPGASGLVRGLVRDELPAGVIAEGHIAPLDFEGSTTIEYRLEAQARGDLSFGDVFLRLEGPWGLCSRQVSVSCAQTVKVFPDLTALTKDALALARANEDDARRRVPLRSEGREF